MSTFASVFDNAVILTPPKLTMLLFDVAVNAYSVSNVAVRTSFLPVTWQSTRVETLLLSVTYQSVRRCFQSRDSLCVAFLLKSKHETGKLN